MKNILTLATIATLLTAGAAVAQDSTPPPADPGTPQAPATTQPRSAPVPSAGSQTQATASAPTGNEPKIAPGSVIPVELTKTVDAKKAKTGDEVVAKVVQDMKTQSGEVLVPKDTKVIGHVTEAQARQKDQKQSELTIAFDQAVLKDQQVSLPMSIQAVIGHETNNNNDNSGASATPSPTASPSPSNTGTAGTSPMAGRTPSGNAGQSSPQGAPTGATSGSGQAGTPRPQINAQTQGVIGISNLSLAPNSNAKQGTMMRSEKNNVKLESGTMLLLRVNQ